MQQSDKQVSASLVPILTQVELDAYTQVGVKTFNTWLSAVKTDVIKQHSDAANWSSKQWLTRYMSGLRPQARHEPVRQTKQSPIEQPAKIQIDQAVPEQKVIVPERKAVKEWAAHGYYGLKGSKWIDTHTQMYDLYSKLYVIDQSGNASYDSILELVGQVNTFAGNLKRQEELEDEFEFGHEDAYCCPHHPNGGPGCNGRWCDQY
jgi:hypothetical protein